MAANETTGIARCGIRRCRQAKEPERAEHRRPAPPLRPGRRPQQSPCHSTAGRPQPRLPVTEKRRGTEETPPGAGRQLPRAGPATGAAGRRPVAGHRVGAPEEGALLTLTTSPPFLPSRGVPLLAHLPQPLRALAKPYRNPGRARRGGSAARNQ